MKDQHKKIKGYRDLSQAEIDTMNEIKAQGEVLGQLIDKLFTMDSTDKRWVGIAQTDLQTGVMAAVRSVAQPSTF
ncbi:hypothetical protein HOU78_gp01 [Vibrio phage 1.204.O._10N.222.46.F12]|uniref:Acb2/Tad1 hairpin domain-containing protein n=1 Tax=Vibrio phage 1.204.O._10N.222.46.F12 TaxID=1881263 RepID=A0A2I7RNK8_9CAUD|nr:hypothetical protein HOU78_gp01 [Vibrio phage 1.204.O._10N.222.46.F12]AUR95221.1 hypothetical protein NVP1204O_01 [Vibrio phage 1.204.O._10N.222.46.F12]